MLSRVIGILRRHQENPALYAELVRSIFAYGSPQAQMIERARSIASEAHRLDRRHDGEPYIRHPELVSVISMEYLGCADPIEISGALLHDVPEDHGLEWPIQRIGEDLGKEVAEIVDWVNLRRFDVIGTSAEERHRLYFHNLRRVAPLRAVRIKLSDQFHNGLTPWNLSDKAWVDRKLHDLHEDYIPMAKEHGVLYQELIQVAEALQQGICLLPPLVIKTAD